MLYCIPTNLYASHQEIFALTARNKQLVENKFQLDISLATLPTAVNSIEQWCYTRFSVNNIVQLFISKTAETLYELHTHNFLPYRSLIYENCEAKTNAKELVCVF